MIEQGRAGRARSMYQSPIKNPTTREGRFFKSAAEKNEASHPGNRACREEVYDVMMVLWMAVHRQPGAQTGGQPETQGRTCMLGKGKVLPHRHCGASLYVHSAQCMGCT